MADYESTLNPEGQQLLLDLGNAKPAAALARAIAKIVLMGASQAKQNATGRPGPNVDTGRLRSSINGQTGVDADGFFGLVGTPVEYGPILENGFSGPVSVRYCCPTGSPSSS